MTDRSKEKAEVHRYGTVDTNAQPGVPDRPVADVVVNPDTGGAHRIILRRARWEDRPSSILYTSKHSLTVRRQELYIYVRHLLYVLEDDVGDPEKLERIRGAIASLDGLERPGAQDEEDDDG